MNKVTSSTSLRHLGIPKIPGKDMNMQSTPLFIAKLRRAPQPLINWSCGIFTGAGRSFVIVIEPLEGHYTRQRDPTFSEYSSHKEGWSNITASQSAPSIDMTQNTIDFQ